MTEENTPQPRTHDGSGPYLHSWPVHVRPLKKCPRCDRRSKFSTASRVFFLVLWRDVGKRWRSELICARCIGEGAFR